MFLHVTAGLLAIICCSFVLRNVVSRVAWPVLGSKSQDISASVVPILLVFFNNLFPVWIQSVAKLNCCTTPLTHGHKQHPQILSASKDIKCYNKEKHRCSNMQRKGGQSAGSPAVLLTYTHRHTPVFSVKPKTKHTHAHTQKSPGKTEGQWLPVSRDQSW